MQKTITTFLFCSILSYSFGQPPKKTSAYVQAQYNATMHDVTKGNNPWGIGLGFQGFLNNKTLLKPTIEVTGDIYLMDDKIYRTDSTGMPLNDVRGMITLFVGTAFCPVKNIYFSVLAGPGFLGGQTLLGIRPTFGFYCSKSQRWAGKISYLNIFNRGKVIKEDFGSLTFAVGLKLF